MNWELFWTHKDTLAALIYPINNAFQTNYMFLARHSNNPALKLVWKMTGGTGGISYILGLAVLIIVVLHFMFAIYAILNRRSGDRSSR